MIKKISFPIFCLTLLSFSWSCSTEFFYKEIEEFDKPRTFKAKGYFSNDPIPMLVNDPIWLRINTPKPDSAYLLLSGPGIDSLLANPDNKYYGTYVTVTGETTKGPKFRKQHQLKANIISIDSASLGSLGPSHRRHCDLYPSLCTLGRTLPSRYALLYSGGKILADANIRFWNDLELVYLTLTSKCGFDPSNIFVVYKNGDEEYVGSPMDVRYKASSTELDNAIAALNLKMNDTATDTLFIFTTNHGGGMYFDPAATSSSGSLIGGVTDSDFDEVEASDPADNTDETLYYYRGDGIIKSMRDDTWKNKLSALLSAQSPFVISLYQQCFSGGFLKDMKQTTASPPITRINIAAASEYGNSFGMPPDHNYDTFSYYFALALLGANLDGSPLSPSPDIPNPTVDGKISIWEAFRFAHLSDPAPASGHEHFIDDNGDGDGYVPPSTILPTIGNNGHFSNSLFLKW